MFPSHLRITKNTEVETFKDLMWKWRSQEGLGSVHLPWVVSKLSRKGHLAMELFLTVPALLSWCSQTCLLANAPWICTVSLCQLCTLARRERLFISYPSCLCVICQMSHASSASSLCHTGSVTVECSCFSSWWFTDVLSSLGSHPPEQGRFHLQLKLPTVLSLAWVDRRPPFHGTLLGHPHYCVVVASSSFFVHYQGWT